MPRNFYWPAPQYFHDKISIVTDANVASMHYSSKHHLGPPFLSHRILPPPTAHSWLQANPLPLIFRRTIDLDNHCAVHKLFVIISRNLTLNMYDYMLHTSSQDNIKKVSILRQMRYSFIVNSSWEASVVSSRQSCHVISFTFPSLSYTYMSLDVIVRFP